MIELIGRMALLLTFLSFTACQNPLLDEQKLERTHEVISKLSDTIVSIDREWPLLNSKNAVEILRAYLAKHPERLIVLHSPFGDMTFQLFDDTPLHTANFLMLINRNYFDGTYFTRIIDGFIIQGGDNDLEAEEVKRILIGGYAIPPEVNTQHFHQKGALAMARDYENNPEKNSSPYNFYIVEGSPLSIPQIMAIEREHKITVSASRRAVYSAKGGAPHLDGEHTVFGQLIDGWEVLEKLSQVKTDKTDWPLETLSIDFEVIE